MADVCSRARTDSCLAATFTRLDGKSLLVTSTSRDFSRPCFSCFQRILTGQGISELELILYVAAESHVGIKKAVTISMHLPRLYLPIHSIGSLITELKREVDASVRSVNSGRVST